MSRRRRQRFAEPVHTAKIYIGQNVNAPSGKVLRPVSKSENRKIERLLLKYGTGALTKVRSAGVYYDSKRKRAYPAEKTQVIEMLASAETGCAKFTSRVQALARVAAKTAKQDSVLAVTECYGKPIDGTLVAARGAPRRLAPITSRRRRTS